MSFSLPFPDEILALSVYSKRGGVRRIVALGRERLALIRFDEAAGAVEHEADLTLHVPPLARVDRWARGCLQLQPSPGRSSSPRIHLASTALGTRPPVEIAFRVEDRGFEALEAPDTHLGPPGDCDAFHEGVQNGWPGRTLVMSPPDGAPLLFHLDHAGRLAVSASADDDHSLGQEAGDPLAVVSNEHVARLYVSSLALPEEPDHVQEYGWTGAALVEARRSREFDGRLAALLFLEAEELAVAAEWTGLGGSLIHVVPEEEFWVEAMP